jgi:hypothetical protein
MRMKTKFYTLLLLVPSYFLAQTTPAPVYLDVNNVKAKITNSGTNFYDGGNVGGYEVPKGSGKICDFANAFWIGGFDASKNLKIAGQTYLSSGNRVDYWPGPLLSSGPFKGTCPLNGVPQFINNRYKINKTDIDAFKIAWQNGSVQNGSYTVPNSVSSWPGTYALNPKEVLAPYFDNNNDTTYNPLDGDYPLIKGDQAIFVVFNDMGNTKTATGTAGIGLEIRRMSYAYTCSNLPSNLEVINYTTFHEYTIINKGNNVLDSMVIGLFEDADLGGYGDDYIGCDVMNDVGYVYNGDNFDANASGALGYLTEIPIYAYKLLRTAGTDGVDNDLDNQVDEADEALIREMAGFTYFNNNTTQYGDPISGQDFYNYLIGKFRSGENLVYGGNGLPKIGGTNVPTRYAYPGLSDPQNLGTNNNIPGPAPVDPITGSNILVSGGWSESNTGSNPSVPNAPDDRRYVMSSRYQKMNPGDTRRLNTAQIFTPNPQSASFNNLLPTAQQDWKTIDSLYMNNAFPSNCVIASNLSSDKSFKSTLKVFPNPSKQTVYISGYDQTLKSIKLEIRDTHGKLIRVKEMSINGDLLKVDVKDLDNGIYLMTLVNEGKTFKIVKAE